MRAFPTYYATFIIQSILCTTLQMPFDDDIVDIGMLIENMCKGTKIVEK